MAAILADELRSTNYGISPTPIFEFEYHALPCDACNKRHSVCATPSINRFSLHSPFTPPHRVTNQRFPMGGLTDELILGSARINVSVRALSL